jgi:hypothetical protein
MNVNDFDWAQEVEDALAEQEVDRQTDRNVEAHAMLRAWFSLKPPQVLKA